MTSTDEGTHIDLSFEQPSKAESPICERRQPGAKLTMEGYGRSFSIDGFRASALDDGNGGMKRAESEAWGEES
jgi:hypothetical protein